MKKGLNVFMVILAAVVICAPRAMAADICGCSVSAVKESAANDGTIPLAAKEGPSDQAKVDSQEKASLIIEGGKLAEKPALQEGSPEKADIIIQNGRDAE